MTRKERDEFLKILEAHARTIGICEACAISTRDLAAEVRRGGTPARDDLQRQVDEAEQVLVDLMLVRKEVDRLIEAFGPDPPRSSSALLPKSSAVSVPLA
jgi:hypothetical protein